VSTRVRIALAVLIAAAVAAVGWVLVAGRGELPQRDPRRALEAPARGPRKFNQAAEKHTPGPRRAEPPPPVAP